ncbi:MAG: Fic family protein [Bdellovibrionota bacterium]|nr:Fic family protein [Bdellovibrionota bacterium]
MLLDKKGITSKEATYINEKQFLKIIEEMKSNFDSDLFGKPKDESFSSSINQIYQSFGGQDLYPSIEEKAATLLYLITKNHSFLDGNKRIAASCFLYFLNKNKLLYLDNKKPLIDNATLCSLTLLIAESNPKDMNIIKQVIISVLNRNRDIL